MNVPFFEIRRFLYEKHDLWDAAERVLRSGRFILGPEVEAFETECAAFLNVKHAVGVSSGTDALLASLMALGVGAGDEVLVPAFTFAATATAVTRLGARPVFVDVRDDDLTMDVEKACALAARRTVAAIPVHLFGAIARTQGYDVPVIEDAAQAFGAFFGESLPTHSFSICHSFFPTKNLGGFGDGGLVTTHDDATAKALRALRNHGSEVRYRHDMIGGNFRLDAMQAALLRVVLRDISRAIRARRINEMAYHERLVNLAKARYLQLPAESTAPNQFVIRVPADRVGHSLRDALREHLAAQRIGSEIYYPSVLPLQPCFRSLGYRPGSFPVAERAAREVLALPIFPGLHITEIDFVCAKIREFFL